VKGTGLGLAIARQLMHLMDGELAVVASAPGTGTTFAVSLPRVDENTPPPGGGKSALG
jgi:signal transduction histidine kinase